MYLHACQVRVTVGDASLRCCTCVTYFEREFTPLCVDSFFFFLRQVNQDGYIRAKHILSHYNTVVWDCGD